MPYIFYIIAFAGKFFFALFDPDIDTEPTPGEQCLDWATSTLLASELSLEDCPCTAGLAVIDIRYFLSFMGGFPLPRVCYKALKFTVLGKITDFEFCCQSGRESLMK